MNLFNRMKDSFTVAGAEVNQKVTQAAEALKINNKIRSNEKEIDKLIYLVGEKFMEQHLMEEDTEYEEFFDKIRFYKSDNEALQEELVRLEREGEEKSQQRQQEMKERQEQRERERREMMEARQYQAELQTVEEPEVAEVPEEAVGEPETVLDETSKRCPNCKQINDRDARFCVNCGTPFAEESEE